MYLTLEFCTLVMSRSSPRPSRSTCHKSPSSTPTAPIMLLWSLPKTRVDVASCLTPRSRVGHPRATKKAASILDRGNPTGLLLKATLMASLRQRLTRLYPRLYTTYTPHALVETIELDPIQAAKTEIETLESVEARSQLRRINVGMDAARCALPPWVLDWIID